jgi:hypothetical protein
MKRSPLALLALCSLIGCILMLAVHRSLYTGLERVEEKLALLESRLVLSPSDMRRMALVHHGVEDGEIVVS